MASAIQMNELEIENKYEHLVTGGLGTVTKCRECDSLAAFGTLGSTGGLHGQGIRQSYIARS